MESDALICDKRLWASSKPAAASTITTGQADNNKQGSPLRQSSETRVSNKL